MQTPPRHPPPPPLYPFFHISTLPPAPHCSPGFPFQPTRGAAEAQLVSRSCKLGEAMISYWFLTPTHQVVETLAVNALFLPLAATLARTAWRVGVPAAAAAPRGGGGGGGGGALALVDRVLSATTLVCSCFTVWYKLQPDCAGRVRLAYILQPCHLSNLMLVALSGALAAGWGERFSPLFEVYLCTVFGAVFALATPDFRGLYLPLEVPHFIVQHVLLLALPCVWIARRRFRLIEDWRSWVCCWAGMTLVHWDVFQPACWLSGHNVNYMMVPPEGFVMAAGRAYRPLMIAICFAASWLVKQAFSGVATLSGARAAAAAAEEAAGGAVKVAPPQTGGGGGGGAGAMPGKWEGGGGAAVAAPRLRKTKAGSAHN